MPAKRKYEGDRREQLRQAAAAHRKKDTPKVRKQWVDYKRRKMERLAGRPKPDRCDICGRGGKICFDHCHTLGVFRGWLCNPCNATLGFVKDNPELLRKLARYLEGEGWKFT